MNDMLGKLRVIIRQLAQREIMPRFNRVSYSFKADGSLVTEADTAMQSAVIMALGENWPEYRLLGEEMDPGQHQVLLEKNNGGLWVLDPLDGTTNFASGIPVFSVSLALLINGEVELGLVYDPLRDESFSAIRGQGAWLNEQPLKPQVERQSLDQCIAQVDLKRLPAELATRLASEHPFASQRNFGSGALDWCWLAAGRSQLYVHGGQKLWDYVAGYLILQEAGGRATTLEGETLFNHSLQPRSVAAAITPQLQALWLNYLAS
jgi:myo-inositol-1(or 4)-monophosphatase